MKMGCRDLALIIVQGLEGTVIVQGYADMRVPGKYGICFKGQHRDIQGLRHTKTGGASTS